MDLLLFLAATAVLLIAGFGAAALALCERRRISLGELAALSVLLGVLFVTLSWWGVSLVVPGLWGVRLVTLLALGLGGLGAGRWVRRRPRIGDLGLFFWLVVPLTAAVAWIAVSTRFEWDGLFIWELKAEAIAVEGSPPWTYFHDDSRAWSHPVYPLLVPFFRAWFHTWIGTPHEAYANAAGALFVLAAAGLLVSLAARLGAATALVALVLFTLTPLQILGAGSATSGYADFPLAVYYLGAVLYLFHALGPARPGDLRIAGGLAAALPWIKQEGVVLFACLLAVALLTLGPRRWRDLLRLAAPGVVILVAWQTFVAVNRVESAKVFHPVSLEMLHSRLHLGDDILKEMARRALDPGNWGLLWVLFPVAALLGLTARRSRPMLALVLGVAVPLPILGAPYLFSLWEPVTLHVQSSFSRLLLPLSLPAIVLIAWTTALLVFPGSQAPVMDSEPEGAA